MEIYNNIQISAYNEHEEGRIPRLQRVVMFYVGWCTAGQLGNCPLLSLHDHKGALAAVWRADVQEADQSVLKRAWGMECEYTVDHYTLHPGYEPCLYSSGSAQEAV